MATFSELCRICAVSGRFMFSLFNPQHRFVDIIARTAEIQIDEDDGLPQSACSACFADLDKLEQMIFKCRQSDLSFRASVDRKDVLETTEETEMVEMIEVIEQDSAYVEIASEDEVVQLSEHDDSPSCVDDLIIVDSMAQVAESQEANYTQCCGCVESFESHEELLRHSQMYHKSIRGICGPVPDNLIECSICYKMFSGIPYLDSMHRLNAFKDRLSSVGFPEKMQCCSCETMCSNSEEMLLHSQVHIDDRTEPDSSKPFECEICFKRFSKKQTLNFHQKFGYSYKKQITTKRRGCRAIRKRTEIEGSTNSRKCCGCSAEFTSVDSLKQHSQMHHELYRRQTDSDNPFECQVCFKLFPSQIRLEQHRLVPYSLTHKCALCGKLFRSLSILTKHMVSHGQSEAKSVLRPPPTAESVQCEECGKLLQSEHKLTAHMKSAHSQEKPFNCSLCSRRFKWKHMLQNHLRVHTKEKPYTCAYCPRAFTQLADKSRHELTHGSPREYPLRCDVCGKGFPSGRRKLLEKHQELHQRGEEYPFTCQFCDRTFTRLPQRDRHQARHVAERNRNMAMVQIDTVNDGD
nr:zinc finger protein 470-like [Aedes albopictus]